MLGLPSILKPAGAFGPIGLEVALEYVHLIQLTLKDGQLRLNAMASEPLGNSFDAMLDDPPALRAVIKRALKQAPFRGRHVVTAMPSTMTQVLSVNYEVNNGQSDSDAIRRLLVDRIGDDLGDFVVDYMPIRRDQRVSERAALIAMCRKDTVNGYLNVLSKSGLVPQALEIGPVAIKRLVDVLQQQQATASSLVVNCGRQRSYLTLISNRQLLSDDEIEFGEQTVLSRICQALDLEEDHALKLLKAADIGAQDTDDNTRTLVEIIRPELNELVSEIHRGLVYATSETRGQDDTAIYLIGSIARWRGADKLLGRLINHRVKTVPNPLRPFLSVKQREDESEEEGRPEFAVAAGLALRDFQNG